MDTYISGITGSTITLQDDTVADLKALAVLTREPEHALLAQAVEALRAARLRSTQARPAATARTRKASQ